MGEISKKSRLRSVFRGDFGTGFGEVFAILGVLAKDLRLHRPSHRFYNVFCILCELLANARTLNFIAPVDVFRGFLQVDVFR